MSDETQGEPERRKRGGVKGVLLILLATCVLGGGGFYAAFAGLIPLPDALKGALGKKVPVEKAQTVDLGSWENPGFVPVDPLVISLGPESTARHLRVNVVIEVAPGSEAAVSAVLPRVRDVLNTYLRAVDERDLELPRAMARLRAQMLRRVQLVTPEGAVRDLLVQEFLLS